MARLKTSCSGLHWSRGTGHKLPFEDSFQGCRSCLIFFPQASLFLQAWARMRNENPELGKPGTIPGLCKSSENHHGVQTPRENSCAMASERVQDQKGSGQSSELLEAALKILAMSPVSTSPIRLSAFPKPRPQDLCSQDVDELRLPAPTLGSSPCSARSAHPDSQTQPPRTPEHAPATAPISRERLLENVSPLAPSPIFELCCNWPWKPHGVDVRLD